MVDEAMEVHECLWEEQTECVGLTFPRSIILGDRFPPRGKTKEGYRRRGLQRGHQVGGGFYRQLRSAADRWTARELATIFQIWRAWTK